jgi:hypothetical protein
MTFAGIGTVAWARSLTATEYEAATAMFSMSVGQLALRIGTSPRAEYERLQRASDEARLKSEQARLALEQHTAAHGC